MPTITRRGKNHYMLMDAGEISDLAVVHHKWMTHQMGIHVGLSMEAFRHGASHGDESIVARSEQVMSDLEDQLPHSPGWSNVYDVVGSLPVIPALLAGHPQHMRRRERVAKATAPLTIFMDLTSSMGIHRRDILKRGIVMLALVRCLVMVRPVELWVGASLGGGPGGQSGTVAWRIDTAPMDLARSGFHIADVNMSRLFGYAMCESMIDAHLPGSFADTNERMAELREIAGWHDVLMVPRIHLHDPLVTDPVGWIKRVLAPKEEEVA